MNPTSHIKQFIIFAAVCILAAIMVWLMHVRERSMGPSVAPLSALVSSSSQESIAYNGEGYELRVPPNWYVDDDASDTTAVYPEYNADSSSTPMCKIEMTVVPHPSDADLSHWITSRLSSDPTVHVKEFSAAQITIGDSSGVEWSGTMDDVPTTLVYAMTEAHAYEIVPSTLRDVNNDQCGGYLPTFLNGLTLQ